MIHRNIRREQKILILLLIGVLGKMEFQCLKLKSCSCSLKKLLLEIQSYKECAKQQYTCRDGGCIPARFECDKIVDCEDSSDEDHCEEPASLCGPNDFICANG